MIPIRMLEMNNTPSFMELGYVSLIHELPTQLTRQLYKELRRVILSGQIAKGFRLPSTRELAEHGILAPPLSDYFIITANRSSKRSMQGLILGFARCTPAQIREELASKVVRKILID